MTTKDTAQTPRPQTNVSGRPTRPREANTESRLDEVASNSGNSFAAEPGFVAAPVGSLLGYARVSTNAQVIDRQMDQLEAAECDRIFVDRTTGTKSSRPELDRLLQYARPGDSILVTSLDRLGRGTVQLLTWVEELKAKGVHLRILDLGVDTNTPAGLLFLTVVAALAQAERSILVDRVNEGLAAARLRGRVGGRRPSLSPSQQREALRLSGEGRTTSDLAELFGCSTRTIRRLVAEDRHRGGLEVDPATG